MKRLVEDDLLSWKDRSSRKPLIIRGARQVGKSYIVRAFGEVNFDEIVEINFDLSPEKISLFSSSKINEILEYISLDSEKEIKPGRTLLFFDEIQKVPELIAKLRYFFEQCPELHVIAAGSLLDFVLADHEFSMPVGRIEYLYMGPMNFKEFLLAQGHNQLLTFLESWQINKEIPDALHEKLISLHTKFVAIGGMPAAIKAYIETGSFNEVQRVQSQILQTYIDDFAKYKKRINVQLLQLTLERIPPLVGKKLKYVDITPHERAKPIAEAIKMLEKARIVYRVRHSSANKIPLSFEANDKDLKILFLDVGLMLRSMELNINNFLQNTILSAGRGEIAEQIVGQELLYLGENYEDIKLYYWNREKRGSSAEVDYLITHSSRIIPVEVKAGTTGSLKSLMVYTSEKKATFALRFNMDKPSIVQTKTPDNLSHEFTLLSLPIYLCTEIKRILDSLECR